MSSLTKLTPANRRTRHDPCFALRANDELVAVRVHVFWPCTNELEIET